MQMQFSNATISEMLVVEAQKEKWAKDTDLSDVFKWSINHLIKRKKVRIDEVSALIVVSETPDYYMPPVSHCVALELELNDSVICQDILQGVNGFTKGMLQGAMILKNFPAKKVILCMGDVFFRDGNLIDIPEEMASQAFSMVTILENNLEADPMYFEFGGDGKEHEKFMLREGCFAFPKRNEHLRIEYDKQFFESRVNDYISKMKMSILEYAGCCEKDIEHWFLDVLVAGAFQREEINKEYKRIGVLSIGSGISWSALILSIGKEFYYEKIKSEY